MPVRVSSMVSEECVWLSRTALVVQVDSMRLWRKKKKYTTWVGMEACCAVRVGSDGNCECDVVPRAWRVGPPMHCGCRCPQVLGESDATR